MNQKYALAAITLSFFIVSATAVADVVNLLGQGDTFDDMSSATITVDGIQITFTADGTNELNSNSTTFGINDGSDATANNNDEIGGTEVLTLTFDQDVVFEALNAIGLSGDETIELTIGSNATLSLESNVGDVFAFDSDNLVNVGESVQISATNGDFGLESFTIAAVATAVPEPSTWVFLYALSYGLVFRRKHLR